MDLNINIAHLPVYTALATAVLMILHLVLMGRVIAQRGKTEVLIGDGGVDSMQQAIRVHANLLENVPIFLIGLGLAELMAGSTWMIAGLAAVFVIARVLHAVGYSRESGVSSGRLVGTLGTMLSILVVAGYLIWTAIEIL